MLPVGGQALRDYNPDTDDPDVWGCIIYSLLILPLMAAGCALIYLLFLGLAILTGG